jgi:hypothetical protein
MRKQPRYMRPAHDLVGDQWVGRTLSGRCQIYLSRCVTTIISSASQKPGIVWYRRDPSSPMLEALCERQGDPDAETLQFLTEAWKAAYAKAKALGWL